MEFSGFLKIISKIASEKLPAQAAHAKMIPPERIDLLKNQDYSNFNPKKAAILMLVYPKNNESHLALILRNTYPGVHSSQIGFPGGKVELEDVNLEATAIRETFEEIGVLQNTIEIIKPFTEVYIPPSNFLVLPFLGFTKETPQFILNPDEVSALIELPLNDLLNENYTVIIPMSTSYATDIQVPGFEFQNHLVWGATAMMLSEFKETLKNVLE